MPSRKAKKAGTLWDLKRLGDQTRHFPALGILPQPVVRPWNDLRCNRQLMQLFPKPIRARFDRQVLGVWKTGESKPF
jgi:hypothetical protein